MGLSRINIALTFNKSDVQMQYRVWQVRQSAKRGNVEETGSGDEQVPEPKRARGRGRGLGRARGGQGRGRGRGNHAEQAEPTAEPVAATAPAEAKNTTANESQAQEPELPAMVEQREHSSEQVAAGSDAPPVVKQEKDLAALWAEKAIHISFFFLRGFLAGGASEGCWCSGPCRLGARPEILYRGRSCWSRIYDWGPVLALVASTLAWLCRWALDQMYVADGRKLLEGFTKNKKGGVTISIRKHSGWTASWPMAKEIAGWAPAPEPEI